MDSTPEETPHDLKYLKPVASNTTAHFNVNPSKSMLIESSKL